jgi:hypothetical protein
MYNNIRKKDLKISFINQLFFLIFKSLPGLIVKDMQEDLQLTDGHSPLLGHCFINSMQHQLLFTIYFMNFLNVSASHGSTTFVKIKWLALEEL